MFFPISTLKLKKVGEKILVFDPIRKKYIVLTPEEWVRQQCIQWLIQQKGYRAQWMQIERGLQYGSKLNRSDILVMNTEGKPQLLVECKAAYVALSQETVEQLCRYNHIIGAKYIMLTNGLEAQAYLWDEAAQMYQALDELPAFG